MAYQFTDEYIAKAKIVDELDNEFTLTGINGKTNDATAVMGGLSLMLDIVGWTINDAYRIVTQDIEEVNESNPAEEVI